MVWNRDKLVDVANARLSQRADLEPIEDAALAYARWQGLTDEEGVDTEAAKRALDRSLEKLDEHGPDAWEGLAQLAEQLGDAAIIGLMQHSLSRSVEQMRSHAVEPEADASAQTVPDLQRKPKRDKGRDR